MYERWPAKLCKSAILGSLVTTAIGVVVNSSELEAAGGLATYYISWIGYECWKNRARTETADASFQSESYIEPPPPPMDDIFGIVAEAEAFLRRRAGDQ
jgi:hypothetical protein